MREKSTMVFGNRVFSGADSGTADQQLSICGRMEILDFTKKEYKKYDVVSDLDMELKDVMYVTYEMMDYLIGDRENLDVYTVVEGKEQDFF